MSVHLWGVSSISFKGRGPFQENTGWLDNRQRYQSGTDLTVLLT